jgi:hypothetical protein
MAEVSLALDQTIYDVIDSCALNLNDFRSSGKMKVLFCRIAESSIITSLACGWNHESIKRLDSWMKIFINFLNIPLVSSFTGVGSYFSLPPVLRRQLLTDKSNNSADVELVAALKYLLVAGLTLVKESEKAIVSSGSDESLDAARVDITVALLVFRLSSFVPWHLTIFENCPVALKYLTCALLGVKGLSDDVLEAITKVNCSIRSKLHGDDFAELLHNEKVSAVSNVLRIHIGRYIKTIRMNSSRLTKYCRDNEVKLSLCPRIVAELKSENYDCPQDVLRVYQRKYKSLLTMVPIPLQSLLVRDIKQAMKDIQRERMVINGEAYFGTADTVDLTSEHRTNVKCDALGRIVGLLSTFIFGSAMVIGQKPAPEANIQDVVGKDGLPACKAPASDLVTLPARVPCTKSLTSIPEGAENEIVKTNSADTTDTTSMELNKVIDSLTSLEHVSEALHIDGEPEVLAEISGSSLSLATLSLFSSYGLHSISDPARNFSVEHLVAFLSDDSGITPTSKGHSESCNSGVNSLNGSPRAVLSATSDEYIERLVVAESPSLFCTKDGDVHSHACSRTNSVINGPSTAVVSAFGDVSDCESITTNNSAIAYSRSTSLSSACGVDDDLSAVPRQIQALQPVQGILYSIRQQKVIEYAQLKENLLKLLLNYVILAACRTTAGGDAFVLLNHLYGGEGLGFCPSRNKRGGPEKVDEFSTKIWIHDDKITVSLHDRYNLISIDDDFGEETSVLMSFTCTTTTQISMSAFKVNAATSPVPFAEPLNIEKFCRTLITNPDSVCKQFVTLRPELPR